jgi:hypothetical protein
MSYSKYLETTSTLVKLSTGENFIQCELCGRCYEVKSWDKEKITRENGYWSCSHSDQDTGTLE